MKKLLAKIWLTVIGLCMLIFTINIAIQMPMVLFWMAGVMAMCITLWAIWEIQNP